MTTKAQKHIAIVSSMFAGAGLAIMIRLNATLGEHIGILESSFLVHLVGTIFALFILNRKLNKNFLTNLKKPPKYLFIAGFFGVTMVLMGNYVVPKLGLALTISILVCCGLTFSTIADHIGVFGLKQFKVTGKRIIGLLLVIMGVLLIFWG
ncbi:MAG: DMT family transporter [bacterium]|nr:DMT family transporter [bacterium]MBU1918665.1 DMT family transporter [bacterium]